MMTQISADWRALTFPELKPLLRRWDGGRPWREGAEETWYGNAPWWRAIKPSCAQRRRRARECEHLGPSGGNMLLASLAQQTHY